MKLTLTAAEAAPLVVRALIAVPKDTEVEIIETTKVPAFDASASWTEANQQLRILTRRALGELRHLVYDCIGSSINPLKRIPGIKLLREFTPYGLAQSKWAIDHFEEFSAFVEKEGRFPVIERSEFELGKYRML